MAEHTITLTAAQEAAILDLAQSYAAATPPLGDGTVDGVLGMLLSFAVERMRAQVLAQRGERLRARWNGLTVQQKAQITAILEE